MFSFASKMLNTIMGTEEGGGPPGSSSSGFSGQDTTGRPMGMYSTPTRPLTQSQQSRPYGTASGPVFSGPRPTPGLMSSRMGPPLTPRFNGPQPFPRGGPSPRLGPIGGSSGRFRGPSLGGPPPQDIRPRPPTLQYQHQPPPPQLAPQHIPTSSGPGVPSLDLSHLSAEERIMIESVMAKAQQMEAEEVPPPPRSQQSNQRNTTTTTTMMEDDRLLEGMTGDNLCPLCRQRHTNGRDGQECSECRGLFCNRCGGIAMHPETKRPEWTCGNCIKRRRAFTGQAQQQQQPLRPQQQQQGGPQQFPIQSKQMTEWDRGRQDGLNFQGGSLNNTLITTTTSSTNNDDEEEIESRKENVIDERKMDEDDEGSIVISSSTTTPTTQPPNPIPMPTPTFSHPSYYDDEDDFSEEDFQSNDLGSIELSSSPIQLSPLSPSNKIKDHTHWSPILSPPLQPPPPPKVTSPPKSIDSPLPSPISLIQSPGDESPTSVVLEERKSIILMETDEVDYGTSSEEETTSDSDDEIRNNRGSFLPLVEGSGGGQAEVGIMTSTALLLDHSGAGEVYTIPEEEEEGASPTCPDLVTSLSRAELESFRNDN